MNKHIILYIFLTLSICSCITRGETIPVYDEPNAFNTETRYFQLLDTLDGQVVAFQPSYPCYGDSMIYNSTLVLALKNKDTITVLSPCFKANLKKDDFVSIVPMNDTEGKPWSVDRDILQKPNQKDYFYPYWKCISCSYKNTRGYVLLNQKE